MGKLINLEGKRFGFWLVKERGPNKNNHVQWLCKCDCGNEKLVTANSLKSYNSTSCGCNHTPDLTGKIFGKLSVINLEQSLTDKSRRYWLCQCACGQKITVSTNKLRNNKIFACNHKGCNVSSQKTKVNKYNDEINVKNLMIMDQQNKLLEHQRQLIMSLYEKLYN